jgi:hypothetical protein
MEFVVVKFPLTVNFPLAAVPSPLSPCYTSFNTAIQPFFLLALNSWPDLRGREGEFSALREEIQR